MKKRLFNLLLTLAIFISCCVISVYAATNTAQTRSAVDESTFRGLVIRTEKGVTMNLYSGYKSDTGSKQTPSATVEEDGQVSYYYADLAAGGYRCVSSQSGYYKLTKNIYLSEAEAQTCTEHIVKMDARAGGTATDSWEVTSYHDFSDEMLALEAFDCDLSQWPEYSDVFTTPWFTQPHAAHQMTTQAQLETFVENLDGEKDNMYVYSIGKSAYYGHDVWAVFFTQTDLSAAQTYEQAVELMGQAKPSVLYRALVHGTEPAGGEAALAMIQRLDGAYGEKLLEDINVVVVPRANPDGARNYKRTLASGVDPNRDMLRLESQEIIDYVRLYNLIEPEMIIDGHELDANPSSSSIYDSDVTVGLGFNLNSTEAYTQESIDISRAIFDKMLENGMTYRFYSNQLDSENANISRPYFGQQGVLSFLLETRGIGCGTVSLPRRVISHVICTEYLLDYAAENAQAMQALVDAERQHIVEKGATYREENKIYLDVTTTSVTKLKESINRVYQDGTEKAEDVTPKVANSVKRSRTAPTAYVIPAAATFTEPVLKLMDKQGISYTYIPAGATVQLRQYTGTVEEAGLTGEKLVTFQSGAYVFSMAQVRGNILALLMEPDVTDLADHEGTLVQQGIITATNGNFPIYRYCHDLNEEGFIDYSIAEVDEISRLNSVSAQLEQEPLDFTNGNNPVCPFCGTQPDSWQVLDKCTGNYNLTGNAHYYLAEDQVNNTHYYNINKGANICIYLNGKDILSTKRAFYVAGGGTLTIMGTKESTIGGTAVDETDTRGIALDTSGGTINVLGGIYTQNAKRNVAFLRTANSVLNIYAGTLLQGDAAKATPVVKMDAKNCILNMYGGEITGGKAAGNGGNIYSSGSGIEINIMGGKVTNGVANSGGNISAGSGATVTISGDGEVSGGKATGSYSRGGNIFVGGSCNLIISGGIVKDGCSETVEDSRGGGNIQLYGGDMTMTGGVVENGTSAIYGGNLFMSNGSVATITGGIITGGTAEAGGNICLGVFTTTTGDSYKTTLNIAGGTVTGGNSTSDDLGGGNILVIGNSDNLSTLPVFHMSGGTVSDGNATYAGGNIYASRCEWTMTDGTISGGTTTKYGGGVFFGGSATKATMSGGTITGNSSKQLGGNVYIASLKLAFQMVGGSVSNGVATEDGGNFYVNNGIAALLGGEITGGSAKRGGNVVAGGGADDSLTIGGCAISDGKAQTGKDIYLKSSCHLRIKETFASECSLNVHSKHLTDGAVLASVDSCEGPFPGKLYLENRDNMPVYGVAGSTALYIGGAMLIRDGETVWFADNAEAVAAYGDAAYMRVMAGELVLTGGDYVVDLAGNPVTITGNGTVTVFDSANDQFAIFGTATIDGPTLTNPQQYTHEGKTYITLCDNGSYSFHYLQLRLTGIALRPGTAGIYYKSLWNCDDALMAQLATAGVAVSLAHTPDSNFTSDDETLYTAMATEALTRGESFTSAIVDNIFVKDGEDNSQRGMMDIYAVPYITLKDGRAVLGGNAAYSLYDVLKLMDEWSFYNNNKLALDAFANTWEAAMADWDFDNIGVIPADDGTLRILMVGNSFCYYYVEELYALLMESLPEGVDEVEIYNLYYSGCKLNQHLQWWQEGTAKYDYYCTDKTGRTLLGEKGSWTLEAALALGNWDYISLQNGSATYAVDDIETAAQTYVEQAGPLLNRFHELFPDAQLLWQRTWAFEVGRVSGSTTYTEEMLVEYDKNAQYVSDLICETYRDLGIIPVNSGIAWKNARVLDAQRAESLLPYGGLCARLGIHKFGDLRDNSGDGYHDGDIGGAQLLNAYLWYMTITGDYDLSHSSYEPVYTYNGVDYTLSAEHIALLKDAAEQAWK